MKDTTKDPAFLFYSNDFYEGTRLMLPEERACYIDLLIFQHQNGYITNDLKRLKMYCSGIDEATLQATLEAKFKQCDKGWYNEKLKSVVNNRENYANKQSINGQIGQFFKRAKLFLTKKQFLNLQKDLKNISKDDTLNISKSIDYSNKEKFIISLNNTLKGLLKHRLNIYENEDEIENEDKDINKKEKEGLGEKTKTSKIIYPFQTKTFLDQWQNWKSYKSKEFNFKYKSEISEQAALKKLAEISSGNEQNAIAIIHQSISEGWKGFFEINTNFKSKTNQDPSRIFGTNRPKLVPTT